MTRASRWWITSLAVGLALAGPVSAAAAAEAQDAPVAAAALPRAAIEEFEWGTVSSSVQALFGTHVDIGRGIRALLTTRLLEAGQMRLVDRAPGAAGRDGVDTVDFFLRGDVITFGRDDRDDRVGLGQIGLARTFGGLVVRRQEHRAVVAIAYRLVRPGSGEIAAAGEARGESTRSSTSIGSLLGGRRGLGGGSADLTSRDFAETMVGEAVMAAADRLVVLVNQHVSAPPARP